MRIRRLAAALGAFAVGTVLVPAGVTASPPPVLPCEVQARLAMPEGEDHDHLDVAQHRLACRIDEVFFDSLADELAEEPSVVLGEMDVEKGIAAVAVALPESGVLFFDVSKPARPKFLSWYRGSKCEQLVFDIDCGAYVDLSEDGKVAFLSVQSLSVLPSSPPDPGVRPVPEPGIEVIDLTDPRQPLLTQVLPVPSQSGVHTSRSHVIPQGSAADGPRAPGEYLFSVQNGFGIFISEVIRPGGVPLLVPLNLIEMDEAHDTFLHNDPLTDRTYLYVAAGFESGFYVFDVTDPSQPDLVGEWDPTPECPNDWYGHTVDTAIRRGHRYVTIDAELFNNGGQTGASSECGIISGNADKVGPLWIVDATDLTALQPALAVGEDDNQALRKASKRALVATWTNPARRAGGVLTFSPHNQQVVGDRIYLSHYHGGVYVLDASAAFRGKKRTPRVEAFVVPHGAEMRPLYALTVQPAAPFFSTFPPSRPEIWDLFAYRGHILVPDMYGGFYSFRLSA